MGYKVIKKFLDLKDGHRLYETGDSFPRPGLVVSEERIKELSTGSNRRGIPLIEEVEDGEEQNVAVNESDILSGAENTENDEKAEVDTLEESEPSSKQKKGRKKNAD
jgi:hypothetical protein